MIRSIATPTEQTVWEATAPTTTVNSGLTSDMKCDIAVVGGGFSGLSAAWHIKQLDPGANVVLVEGRHVGAGSSGKAAGNCFSLFGESLTLVRRLFGKEKTLRAHQYIRSALDYLDSLIRQHGMQSDYRPTEFLRVATTQRLRNRLTRSLRIYEELGVDDDFQLVDEVTLRDRFPTSPFTSGLVEKRCAVLNPMRHLLNWKQMCEDAGVKIFESTPVVSIDSDQRTVLTTPRAQLTSDKVICTLNAFSHELNGLRGLRSKQSPVWTHMIATSPLSDLQRRQIGWAHEEAMYDCLNRLHYFRLTPCGRICMGGGKPGLGENGAASSPQVWQELEKTLTVYFPPLSGIKIDYRWKGPVSVCADLVPTIGFLGNERVAYSCGFVGHGIPISQLNGRVLAEITLGKSSEWSDFWMINRRVFPWPPRPFRRWVKKGILLLMAVEDAWAKRK